MIFELQKAMKSIDLKTYFCVKSIEIYRLFTFYTWNEIILFYKIISTLTNLKIFDKIYVPMNYDFIKSHYKEQLKEIEKILKALGCKTYFSCKW